MYPNRANIAIIANSRPKFSAIVNYIATSVSFMLRCTLKVLRIHEAREPGNARNDDRST
jgi:hypothetical protein